MSSPQLIPIIIVDDQPAVRSALEAALFIDDRLEIVGVANNGQEAVALCGQCKPSLVLMDIRMPIMDGIEATRLIRQQYPQITVLALTSFLEPELVQNMMHAGASGYLLKHIGADELSNAIHAAVRGESVLDSAAYKTLFEHSEAETREDEFPTDDVHQIKHNSTGN